MVKIDYAGELHELNRQKLFRRRTQSILLVQSLGNEAQRLRTALSTLVVEMQRHHHLNRELMLVEAKRKATYVLIWLAAAACYLLDFVLLSAVAEYFARRVYSDPVMVMLARTIIPAAIIIIEMLVSTQRTFAHDLAAEYGRSKTQRVWVVFTVLLLLFVPIMLIATYLVTLPENLTPLWTTVSFVQLLGLLALAAVLHGAILYGGQLAVEAKAYLFLRLSWYRMQRREKRLDDRAHAATATFKQAYLLYQSLAQELAGQSPTLQLEPARFDTNTQRLLSEAFDGQLTTSNAGLSCTTRDVEVLDV
jgi:uncharacterized membrane-anchored protein